MLCLWANSHWGTGSVNLKHGGIKCQDQNLEAGPKQAELYLYEGPVFVKFCLTQTVFLLKGVLSSAHSKLCTLGARAKACYFAQEPASLEKKTSLLSSCFLMSNITMAALPRSELTLQRFLLFPTMWFGFERLNGSLIWSVETDYCYFDFDLSRHYRRKWSESLQTLDGIWVSCRLLDLWDFGTWRSHEQFVFWLFETYACFFCGCKTI